MPLIRCAKKKPPANSVKKGCPVRRFRPDLARKGAGMITVMVPERALQRGARRRPSSWRLRAVHEHAKGVSQRASPVSGCGTHPCWRTRADDHHPRPPGRPRLCPVIVVPVRPVRVVFCGWRRPFLQGHASKEEETVRDALSAVMLSKPRKRPWVRAAQPAAGPRQSVRDHVTWGGAKTPSVTHGIVRRGSGRVLFDKALPSLTPFSTCDERAAARGARRAWWQRVIEHREAVHDVPG